MSARIYNLDTERGRRRPFASTPATHDALARVVVLEPGPVAPLEPPRRPEPSRWRDGLVAVGMVIAGFRAALRMAVGWRAEEKR